jgi:hypothetical protein
MCNAGECPSMCCASNLPVLLDAVRVHKTHKLSQSPGESRSSLGHPTRCV